MLELVEGGHTKQECSYVAVGVGVTHACGG